MRRGEVRWIDLGRARGSEAAERRLALIVSNDQANAAAARLARGVLTVLPITSNVARVYPFQVLLPEGTAGLDRDSKVQAEQVRSVAFERVGELIGQAPPAIMDAVDAALRLHVAL